MTFGLDHPRSRRALLRAGLLVPIGLTHEMAGAWAQPGAPPIPTCADTPPAETEGPFFKPRSPERTSLIEPGMTGMKLVLTGYVLSAGCKPLAHALLDFWHADERGIYDTAGFRLRGHQFTDDQGRYRLETIVPGVYVGRTRHFHVKVQPPNRPVLTTQLYFPGEAVNARDPIFSPELVMRVTEATTGKAGTFDFVVDLGRR